MRKILYLSSVLLLLSLSACGDPQGSKTNTDLEPREDATCDFAGPKALCRSSAEGVRAHIEEFGPLQKEMDWIILDGFDPNDVEELVVVESVVQLQLTSLESTDLQFLSGLTSATRISIERNFELESLQGLENLELVNESIELRENTALQSLAGLSALKQVKAGGTGGGMRLLQNHSLTNLDGLDSLEQASVIDIQSNNGLESPGSFPKLTSVGAFVFDNNDVMTTAGDYPSLKEVSFLTFRKNDVLPDCESEKVAEAIPDFDGKLTLEDNKPNSRCADLE
mgnify:CR=1 FL=1